MHDALGNELQPFDVIHFGTQIGIVLGMKDGKSGHYVIHKMRVLSRGTRYARTAMQFYERVSYLNDAHETAVKLHPDYWTDGVRQFVADARERYPQYAS